MSSILKVYALVEENLPARDCCGRADCCRFKLTGMEPHVTDAEFDHLLAELKKQGRRIPPARSDGACPLLGDDARCTVYAARPLGCRTHFCREAGGPAGARAMRDAIQLLNTLDEAQKRGRRGGRPLTRALDDARRGRQERPIR